MSLLDLFANGSVSLCDFNVEFPGLDGKSVSVGSMHVVEVVARLDALLGVLLPELKDLVLLGTFDELVSLLLILFPEVILPPVPQELGLHHFPDFSGVFAEKVFLQVVLLEDEEVLPERSESVAVIADVLELLEHNSLLESVEGYLDQLVVVLPFTHGQLLLDEGLMPPLFLGMEPKLDDNLTLKHGIAVSLEGLHDLPL